MDKGQRIYSASGWAWIQRSRALLAGTYLCVVLYAGLNDGAYRQFPFFIHGAVFTLRRVGIWVLIGASSQ
jgi:hypothetical protein